MHICHALVSYLVSHMAGGGKGGGDIRSTSAPSPGRGLSFGNPFMILILTSPNAFIR